MSVLSLRSGFARVVCAAVTLAVCVSAAPHAARAGALDDLANSSAADRHDKIVAGAKQEGALTIYSSMQTSSFAPFKDAFEAKYGIKINLWRGSGKDILRRVVTESRANRDDLDLVETDGFALEALSREGVLHAVTSPYFPDLIPQALRPDHAWVATRVNIFTGVYNTAIVKKETLPKTYEDLRDPKYKGMLGIEATDYDWFGALMGKLGEEKGLKIFQDFIKTNGISARKGHTLLNNLAVAGEVPIGLNIFMQNADKAKKAGAPVDWFTISPIIARTNGIAIAKDAPHPHAALLFYDFMLSEGQPLMLKRSFTPVSKKIPNVLNTLDVTFAAPGILLDDGPKWQKIYNDLLKDR